MRSTNSELLLLLDVIDDIQAIVRGAPVPEVVEGLTLHELTERAYSIILDLMSPAHGEDGLGWDDLSGEELLIALLGALLDSRGPMGRVNRRRVFLMARDRDEDALRDWGRTLCRFPIAPEPIMDKALEAKRALAAESHKDALHGRAPGPRIGERGGPGEPPPGDDPG